MGHEVWPLPGPQRRDGNASVDADGSEQSRDSLRLEMKGFELDERAARFPEPFGRMRFGPPFNQRGSHAVERQAAIRAYGDEPVQLCAAHRLDVSQRFRRHSKSRTNVGGPRHPCGEPGWSIRFLLIELVPPVTARYITGWDHVGIDGRVLAFSTGAVVLIALWMRSTPHAAKTMPRRPAPAVSSTLSVTPPPAQERPGPGR